MSIIIRILFVKIGMNKKLGRFLILSETKVRYLDSENDVEKQELEVLCRKALKPT